MSGEHVVAAESTTTTTTTEKKGGGVMRVHVAVVCSAVGLLGFIILILGVAGEAATAQAYVRGPDDDIEAEKCQYRMTPALACGIAAALLAITAQVVVTATSLCCGCCRTREVPKETRHIVGIILSAVSWITVIIVVALFIAGAALNADQEKQPDADGDCDRAPGNSMFAAATVLSVAATGMQIASYILLLVATSTTKTPLATEQLELAMGQPVVKPEPQVAVGSQDQEPVASAPAPVPSQATEPESQV
ncbi:hypothetical protein SORBI_3001G273600 [Sorghum bicolor]|uniref:Uncharacterized protein n=1 Tax=Sorghum bicolor TaxID=4558 RepID=C5WPU4_SORBI|nr:hypothetical protein SORBI_3001G273600 [Sorghum bicolor]